MIQKTKISQEWINYWASQYCSRLSEADTARIRPAFEAVHRHEFLLPSPWWISAHTRDHQHLYFKSSVPQETYLDGVVSLDKGKNINNGQPSMWVQILAKTNANLEKGDILHLGCGAGYYTAILAKIFPKCTVHYHDTHDVLLTQVKKNLRPYSNCVASPNPAKFNLCVMAFGIDHLPASLVRNLAVGGEIFAPVTNEFGLGFNCKFTRDSQTTLKCDIGGFCNFVNNSARGPNKKLGWRKLEKERIAQAYRVNGDDISLLFKR